jgi:glucosamine-6-phosphate deaminase
VDLLSTLRGSLMEDFLPAGWDLKKIDACVDPDPKSLTRRQPWWHPRFEPVLCQTLADFETFLGHEIAKTIKQSRDAGEEAVLILPVGPMGMYRWVVYFLTEWGVPCDHVHGFNMDEWSDSKGKSLPARDPGSFERAMEAAFYGPLGKLTVPPDQRAFATRDVLPHYADRIKELRSKGAKLAVLFGSRTLPASFPAKRSGNGKRTGSERGCIRSPSNRTRSPASRAARRSFPRSPTRSGRRFSWERTK